MSRVLVVDDDPGIVKVVRAYLEQAGFEVLAAHDGKKAMQIARHERPDLVVLDLMLPEMDGFAVCEKARQGGRDVPILFITARGEVDDRIRGLEAGGDDYLAKPFHLRELLSRHFRVIRNTRGQARSGRFVPHLES